MSDIGRASRDSEWLVAAYSSSAVATTTKQAGIAETGPPRRFFDTHLQHSWPSAATTSGPYVSTVAVVASSPGQTSRPVLAISCQNLVYAPRFTSFVYEKNLT